MIRVVLDTNTIVSGLLWNGQMRCAMRTTVRFWRVPLAVMQTQ